jgi:hypothetical protein
MAERVRGIWLVQLLEYAIGFAIAGAAVNAQHQVPLALIAIAILVNVALLQGPLSAFHVVPLPLHKWTGLGIAVVALASALFLPVDVAGRLTLLAAATTQGFVSVRFAHGF